MFSSLTDPIKITVSIILGIAVDVLVRSASSSRGSGSRAGYSLLPRGRRDIEDGHHIRARCTQSPIHEAMH
jgi:hypothetical protein